MGSVKGKAISPFKALKRVHCIIASLDVATLGVGLLGEGKFSKPKNPITIDTPGHAQGPIFVTASAEADLNPSVLEVQRI